MRPFRLIKADADDVEELHRLAFAATYWPGDDHTYWIARDADGAIAGFCSAVYWPDLRCVFLSRAAVVKTAQGQGLQRVMIDTRSAWAMEEGARMVYSYVQYHNYPSIVNLIKAGFKFCKQEGFAWHHFVLHLRKRGPYKAALVAAIARAGE